ncbi:MAG: type II toxin-antitoxin system RelE/ParE family toxin [Pseudomonadota bacterium]
MIRSFADKRTEEIANGRMPKRFPPDLFVRAQAMLTLLNAAHELSDLRSPPGNRLEALAGDRAVQHSIRVNRQWRICFRWTDTGVEDVEIVDYH